MPLNNLQLTLLVNVAETFTMSQYEHLSGQTAVYPEVGTGSIAAIMYCALGLAGEAGEIALKVNALAFEDSPEQRLKIVAEVGDFLWYVPRLRRELDGSQFSDTTFSSYAERVIAGIVGEHLSLAAVTHNALMLVGRAAEVANRVKKLARDGDSLAKRQSIVGFVDAALYFAPRLLHELAEAPFGEVALANIFKLADRQNRGTLHGDGDNR